MDISKLFKFYDSIEIKDVNVSDVADELFPPREVPENGVVKYDASSLRNARNTKVFYCPNCNQTDHVQFKTYVRYRYVDGQMILDTKYIQNLFDLIGEFSRYLISLSFQKLGHTSFGEDFVDHINGFVELLTRDKPELAAKYSGLKLKDVLYICPNCGYGMAPVHLHNKICMGSLYEDDRFRPPGCWLCGEILKHPQVYNHTLFYCAMCQLQSQEAGVTPNCRTCHHNAHRILFNINHKKVLTHANIISANSSD